MYSISIGGTIFPSTLRIPSSLRNETNIVYPVMISQLLELGRCLKVFDDNRISYYIEKLNTEKDFNKISIISEIIVTSKYIANGYKVDFEPGNKRIGKSGQEGKSDLAVKFDNESIYFEIISEPVRLMPNEMITTVITQVYEQIISQNLLPPTIKIHPIVVDKNKVLAKGWVRNFCEHLKMVSLEENVSNDFDGIHYRVMRRKPDEPPFLFQMPITDTRKRLINTIKREAKQIPDDRKGAVIINSNSE